MAILPPYLCSTSTVPSPQGYSFVFLINHPLQLYLHSNQRLLSLSAYMAFPLGSFQVLALLLVFIIYWIQQKLTLRTHRLRIMKEHGCKVIRRFPEVENPFFEWRFLSKSIGAYRQHRMFDLIQDRYRRLGYTFRAKIMFRYIYQTAEPENVKTMLSTKFNDWNLPDQRKSSFIPLLGKGIFTSDGPAWQHSRTLLKPNFIRSQVGDLKTFETHIEHLIQSIPRDGSTIDLQEPFFRLTIDSATEFLFGESVNSLAPGASTKDNTEFAEAFNRSQAEVAQGARSFGLSTLFSGNQFKKDAKYVHDFVDSYIARRLRLRNTQDPEKADGERYVFLNELVKETQDPLQIRSELLNVLLAGRDTTASLLSNTWFVLAKRPDIWDKLRAEVDELGTDPPTYEQIKEMKYLRAVLNEGI